MLVLEGMPCDAETIRSHLSHRWLGNDLLRLSPSVVATIHQESSDDHALISQLCDECARHLGDLQELVDTMEEAYSPITLINSGPLVELSSGAQAIIKEVLHGRYCRLELRDGKTIGGLRERLQEQSSSFQDDLSTFCSLWSQRPHVQASEIERSFLDLKNGAAALRDALDRLPRGIVLP